MKKILLLGDSIRMGYDKYTRDKLSGVAEVYFPEENCKFSMNMVRYIYEWADQLKLKREEIDVVHWNAGLWDCLHMEDGEPLISVDIYERTIERIQGLINTAYPNARSIFATSTPVSEQMWKWQGKKRYNSEIEQYNEAARRALSKYDVKINDLYALLSPLPDSYHSDATHYYTPESTKLIGDEVVSNILSVLGVSESCLSEAERDYSPDKIIGI